MKLLGGSCLEAPKAAELPTSRRRAVEDRHIRYGEGLLNRGLQGTQGLSLSNNRGRRVALMGVDALQEALVG